MQEIELCCFCEEESVLLCLNRSLSHKYKDHQDNFSVIDSLIYGNKSAFLTQYEQAIMDASQIQHMTSLLSNRRRKQQLNRLQQFYKYRQYVPIFSKSTPTDTILTYYYQKLKNYYNKLKRQLNITVDCTSSQQDHSFPTDFSQNTKSTLLGQIAEQIKQDRNKKMEDISDYKSQSQALEELVGYMKMNKNIWKAESYENQCFNQYMDNQQSLFYKKNCFKINFNLEPVKTTYQAKLFKKVIQNTHQKHTSQTDHLLTKQRSSTRNIRIVDFQGNSSQKNIKTAKFTIKDIELKISTSKSMNSLSKRGSLVKIKQQNPSPNKKKYSSIDKNRLSVDNPKNRCKSIQNIKYRPIAITKNQQRPFTNIHLVKFEQKAQPIHQLPLATPNKKIMTNICLTKTDNILSIRKKKLDALRQKTAKK